MFEVPTTAAETAAGQIMQELARFRMVRDALPVWGGGRLLRRASQERAVAYAAVTAVVAVVEDFAVSALEDRLDRELDGGTVLTARARSGLVGSIERSWDDRVKFQRQWFSPPVDPAGPLAEVRAFVEVRNAIAHGLGKLTRRQLGDDGGARTLATLATVGVSRSSSGVLKVDDAAVARCARSSRALVHEWDAVVSRSRLATT
jgi:hypothetical protein